MTAEPKKASAFARWLLFLGILSALARLPLCFEPGTVRNDGAEYLAIARHLRSEGRYATDLKYQFWTDDPVRHAAWADRPPLYPAVAALCGLALPFLDPTAAARVGNALLSAAALVLAALFLRGLYGERIALLTAGFTFFLPHTLYWTAQPMTEALSLVLLFGSLLLWGGGSPRAALGAGLLAGLLYLARPTGGLLLLAFGLDGLLRRRQRESGAGRAFAAAAAGFLACALPYHLLLWRLYGSPFYSSLGYTFSIAAYYEVTYYGFERRHPTTLEFLRTRGGEVPGLVLRQGWHHLQAIATPLLALLPLAFGMRRGDWSGERRAVGLFVVLTLLVHTLVWSAWGSTRYFLPVLPVLAAALLHAGERVERPAWLRTAALGLTAAGLLFGLARFYPEQARPDRGVPFLPAVRRALPALEGAETIASDRPNILNLLLERPAVFLPRTTDREQLSRFIRAYRPDALVLFVSPPEERAAERMAAAWRAGELPAGWRLVLDQPDLLVARRR